MFRKWIFLSDKDMVISFKMVPNYREKNCLNEMFFVEHDRETGAKTNANVITKENERYRFYSFLSFLKASCKDYNPYPQ